MTEILTESFCERCGTRYTFESARPRTRLKGVRVLSRGLKNFVLSDETSMDEAMAAARSETDRESTAYQLDAFHKTFNFCMQCRQYTCPNCWNEAEVRCLTCAPHLGHEVMPAPFPDLPAAGTFIAEPAVAETSNGPNGSNGWHAVTDPAADDGSFDFAARLAALTAPVPGPAPSVVPEAPIEAVADVLIVESVVADPPAATFEPEPTIEAVAGAPVAERAVIEDLPVVAAQPEPAIVVPAAAPVAEPAVVVGPPVLASEPAPAIETDEVDHEAAARLAALAAAAVVADAVAPASDPDPDRSIGDKITGQTTGLLKRFRPVESLDSELDAYERAPVPPAAEPEPVVAAQPVSAPEPEPVTAAEPEIAAATAPTPPATNDIVPQPTWRMVAPDPAAEDASEPPATQPAAANGANPSAEPQWPERPQWLGGGPSNGLPFLNRPATPQGGLEALWAQSNAEVVNPTGPAKAAGGIQPCVSCGLSLSATAKFCRRCGTPQAG